MTDCVVADNRAADAFFDGEVYSVTMQPACHEGRIAAEGAARVDLRPGLRSVGLAQNASASSRTRVSPELRTKQLFSPASPFADIGLAAATALDRISTRRKFAANEFIYIQDDEATHLNVVVSGYVRLSYLMEDGSAVLHAILPPGESFGELGVFESGSYADIATAAGPVVLACVPATAFRQLCQTHPSLFQGLSRAVAQRYRSYITLTRDLSLKSLSARLAQALLRLADGLGRKVMFRGRTVHCIGAVVSQTDLGLMARGSRGNVNRALKTWERSGWIAFEERRVMILDRSALEALSIEEG